MKAQWPEVPVVPAGRIYYLAPINLPVYEAAIGRPLLVGAAARKVSGVVEALRRAGSSAWVVAAPMLGRSPGWHGVGRRLLRQGRTPAVCLPTVNLRVANRLLAAFHYLVFLLRCHRRGDAVIFYNYFPEYLPAALYLRLRGTPGLLDIEDAPRRDQPGPWGLINRAVFPLLRRLCAKRSLAASRQIAERFGGARACVVHGIVGPGESDTATRDFFADEIRVLFGGSLSQELGLDLFCEAVALLSRRPQSTQRRLRLVVTGFGGTGPLERLAQSCHSPQLALSLRPNLPVSAYRAELQAAHVGLNLRLPQSSYSDTTFPSKVVEYTGAGLLLLTTRVSDVGALFDARQALFLDPATPQVLCRLFEQLLHQPERCAEIAARGRRRAAELFGSAAVGRRLQAFVYA